MIVPLDLPMPSPKLINLVRETALNRPVNMSSKFWHEQQQSSSNINCAAGDFFSDTEITELTRLEYQHLFDEVIYPVVGIIINTNPDKIASYPPHVDRARITALNFYVDEGGEEVTTVLYNQYESIEDTVGGQVAKYEDLTIDHVYKMTSNQWYALNVRQYHSVENIETSRIILSISLIHCDQVKFCEKYQQYIISN